MRPTPTNILQSITNCLQDGQSSRQVAASLGVGKSTVNDIRKRLSTITPKLKPGPKPKMSERDKRATVSIILKGTARSAVDAAKIMEQERGVKVSPETIRRALRGAKLVAAKRKKKPFLSTAHRRSRLRWATERKDWTIEDWARVIWSDETKINRLCSDGVQYSWIPSGSKSERAVQPTVKFGGGSLMVWGCMTWLGTGALAKIAGRMDAQQYVSILERCLVPTINHCAAEQDFVPRTKLIFQQDNDPKHTSRLATAWFRDECIELMQWPAQSPDLNPIEHLWAHLKRRIASYQAAPGGMLELWERVREEWKAITPETCRSLIESMPRRVEAVLKSKGGNTKY